MLLLMCYAGQMRFALPISNVVEVVARPIFEAIPSAPRWVAGSFVHRGMVTPVIDFGSLADLGEAKSLWSSRVIVINCPREENEQRVGILFDRAYAVQTADSPTTTDTAPIQILPWGPTLIDENGTYCLLDMERLLSPMRQAQLFPHLD
jgi:chemotaxis signal transduction protein